MKFTFPRAIRRYLGYWAILGSISWISACGGGGGSDPPAPITYVIGGSIVGLVGTVVIQNNGADNQSASSDSPFTFSTRIASGGTYAVTVLSQPPGQTCTVSNGSGTATADVTNVLVTCISMQTVGGDVSGLTGTVVLQNNGTDSLSISSNGPFTFATAIATGGTYAVTVLTQPAGLTCTVANGEGSAVAAVSNIVVNCAPRPVVLESFESGSLSAGISVRTVGNFTVAPGMRDTTILGGLRAFGFGKSDCFLNCFAQHETRLRIAFAQATNVSTLSFKEIELSDNWGSTGEIWVDGNKITAFFGRTPQNDRQPDTAFRQRTFPIGRAVFLIEIVVTDITSLSEIFIDDIIVAP